MKTNVLYGAIGGDIIGSKYERKHIKHKNFQLFHGKSRVTDDTVFTCATAEAILTTKDYVAAYQAWGRRYPKEGSRTFRAWLDSENPQPYNSVGNGAAMRVSPVGWAAQTLEEVLAEAERSAAVSHNHPEGIKGAQATAMAIFMAKNNASKEEIRKEIEGRFGYDVSSQTIDEIRLVHRYDVTCPGTVPIAIRAFLESVDYEDAIRNAVSVGGDSDTIAAITGGIALAFHKEIPEFIIKEIEARLPEDVKTICDKFNVMFMNKETGKK